MRMKHPVWHVMLRRVKSSTQSDCVKLSLMGSGSHLKYDIYDADRPNARVTSVHMFFETGEGSPGRTAAIARDIVRAASENSTIADFITNSASNIDGLSRAVWVLKLTLSSWKSSSA